MPYKCSVPACRGNYDEENKVATFKFPGEEHRQKKWLQAIQRKNFKITKHSRVCEKHFKDGEVLWKTTFYVEKTGELLSAPIKRPKLKENVVPSLFPGRPSSLSSSTSSGTASKEEEKKDHPIPLEPAIVIKEEPIDYEPTPSTSTATANDEFILPHQENTWRLTAPVVEPQLTFSVASLAPTNDPETPDGELARKKRKIQMATFVPTTNGPDVRPHSPVENFGDTSNPGSTKESRKDQFDVFGEYIAAKLRSLDRKSCAYAQKAIGDIIFEAEMGKFLSEDSDSQDLRNCVS